MPIIDTTHDWYDGIHRALAAKELGIKKMPVAITDIDKFKKTNE